MKRAFTLIEVMICVVMIVVIVGVVGGMTGILTKQTDVPCTFDSKERVTVDHGKSVSSEYRVYCDEEVFANVDSLVFWKFNSSDVQTKFKSGKKYLLTVTGWRIPFLSMFRNIISVRQVE